MIVGLLREPCRKEREDESMVRSEHYFMLSSNRRKIMKLDVFVRKMGIFYEVVKGLKIMMLTVS